MFISLITWNNLSKRLDPAEEPFNGTAFLGGFEIELGWSLSFQMFLGSPVDWSVALDSLFPVIITYLWAS